MSATATSIRNDTVYAAVPGVSFRIDPDRVMWRATVGGRFAMLGLLEASAVGALHTYRPFAQQVELLSRQLNLPRERADSVLRWLVGAGLVVSIEQTLPANAALAATPAPLIVVRTCARPHELSRLLDSLIADEQRFGSRRRYVVVDDAVDPQQARVTEDLVRAFAARTRSTVGYLGPRQRDILLQRLLDLGIAREPRHLGELLHPGWLATPSGSRTWNWAILLSAGGALGMLDDDMVFPLRLPQASSMRVELSNSLEAETHFYDEAQGYAQLPAVDVDPYEYLGRFVGQSAGAVLHHHGSDAISAAGQTAPSLAFLGQARVVAAFPGVYGELGYDSAVFLNLPTEATLRNLFRAPYRHARLQGDNVWQGLRRPRLVTSAVQTPLLTDNRELLPCTSTRGKHDDTLFLYLLANLDQDLAYAYVPGSIGHLPPGRRDRLNKSLGPAIRDVNALLTMHAMELRPQLHSERRDLRMLAMAASYREFAESSETALIEYYQRWSDSIYANVVNRLGVALRQYGQQAPSEWRDYVIRVIEVNEEALKQRQPSPDEIERTRMGMRQMADALALWPELWGWCATNSLKDDGALGLI